MEIFTIGHSNHSIETFITLLQQHGVTALADVRSHPYSRYLPHFSQSPLKSALVNAGISYVFLGRELGARPSDLTCYVDGKAVYAKIASTPQFADGIQRILKGAENYKIALMCAEKDPITCHRAILICHELRNFNLRINHILTNGQLEPHEVLEERLLGLHQLQPPELPKQIQLSLFDNIALPEPSTMPYSREESLQKAYHQQGEQIAYVEKTENKHE
ncbi:MULTISPECIES: DUF488 domain-containing protein [Calothrix]|uniref:DUF488 domain-containing protein n=2 Tax=Calothrix TaxID=1186 RepID=A0ABR8AIV5_9CYAN|nr:MULTISPECIES: DUF488 domain-containing protein [Calothrix]MBD2199906.1 DUF488 domain-containing protein [Calothrix parietina FACHB-288]MBD2228747.1 DUF488 domain-containing protein [Calothrix anomala FACHB-343]